jgi:hypothetical protein
MWIWKGQLSLDAWPNRLLTVWLFAWALWLAVPRGYSFVGEFSTLLDRIFVEVLRKWHVRRCGKVRVSNSWLAWAPITFLGWSGPDNTSDNAVCRSNRAVAGDSRVAVTNSWRADFPKCSRSAEQITGLRTFGLIMVHYSTAVG